jgi:hypothetical protein
VQVTDRAQTGFKPAKIIQGQLTLINHKGIKLNQQRCFSKKVSLTFSTGGNLQIARLMTYASISNSLSRREIFLEIDFSTAVITVVKLILIPSSQRKSGLFKESFSRIENTT